MALLHHQPHHYQYHYTATISSENEDSFVELGCIDGHVLDLSKGDAEWDGTTGANQLSATADSPIIFVTGENCLGKKGINDDKDTMDTDDAPATDDALATAAALLLWRSSEAARGVASSLLWPSQEAFAKSLKAKWYELKAKGAPALEIRAAKKLYKSAKKTGEGSKDLEAKDAEDDEQGEVSALYIASAGSAVPPLPYCHSLNPCPTSNCRPC
jgi:hypothetical protein